MKRIGSILALFTVVAFLIYSPNGLSARPPTNDNEYSRSEITDAQEATTPDQCVSVWTINAASSDILPSSLAVISSSTLEGEVYESVVPEVATLNDQFVLLNMAQAHEPSFIIGTNTNSELSCAPEVAYNIIKPMHGAMINVDKTIDESASSISQSAASAYARTPEVVFPLLEFSALIGTRAENINQTAMYFKENPATRLICPLHTTASFQRAAKTSDEDKVAMKNHNRQLT